MKRFFGCALALAMALMGGVAQAKPRHGYIPPSAALQGDEGDYINVSGHQVHRPVAGARPAGATAQCRDTTWSFSEHHRGACSHHGGVASWL